VENRKDHFDEIRLHPPSLILPLLSYGSNSTSHKFRSTPLRYTTYRPSGDTFQSPFAIWAGAVAGSVTGRDWHALFLLPCVLWSQSVIPDYRTATAWAVLLAAATVFAGNRYAQRFIKAASASTGDGDRGEVASSTAG